MNKNRLLEIYNIMCCYWSIMIKYCNFLQGEFEYPDASKWTNAELGIPDDDEEID